jgi:hypothetical protein
VAITDGDPQPRQAPPPPAHRRRGLKQAPRRSDRQNPPRHPDAPIPAGVITRQPLADAVVLRGGPKGKSDRPRRCKVSTAACRRYENVPSDCSLSSKATVISSLISPSATSASPPCRRLACDCRPAGVA